MSYPGTSISKLETKVSSQDSDMCRLMLNLVWLTKHLDDKVDHSEGLNSLFLQGVHLLSLTKLYVLQQIVQSAFLSVNFEYIFGRMQGSQTINSAIFLFHTHKICSEGI